MAPLALRALRLLRTNPRLFCRRLLQIVRDPFRGAMALSATRKTAQAVQAAYDDWRRARHPFASPESGPLFSVIVPVFNVDEGLLRAAIESVRAQTYTRWELCIADDASTLPHVRTVLEEYSRLDDRIHVAFRSATGHISAATNTALELAHGDFVSFLDHDDILDPNALGCLALAVGAYPDADFLYSDEDKLDESGRHVEPFFKPAWSPTLLTTCNYITHLAAIRRELVLRLGGLRDEVVGSQDHDLFLRVAEHAHQVVHVPQVLYSWRMSSHSTAGASTAKPYAISAARRALNDAVERRDVQGTVHESHLNGLHIIRRTLPKEMIRLSLLLDGTGEEWSRSEAWDTVTICDTWTIGTGDQINAGSFGGDYLLFLDSQSRPANHDSILVLLEHLQNPEVAICSGTTRRPDGRVLQAGLVIGTRGQPRYAFSGLSAFPQPNFYLNLKDLPHEVSAVTTACSSMRRDTFEILEGWDPEMPPSLAMCDLCLRAGERGYAIMYAPLAQFVRRRRLPDLPSVIGHRWCWSNYSDPFWNPNMNPDDPYGLPFQSHQDLIPRPTHFAADA